MDDALDILNNYDIEERCKRYIALPNTWFKAGTDCRLITYLYELKEKQYGQFEGTYVIGNPENDAYDKAFWLKIGYHMGDEVTMKNICCYEEFEINE